MSAGQELAEHARDLLMRVSAPFGRDTRVSRMFGDQGIFCDGVMFALIADEVLYLKIDDETKPAFLDASALPFVYGKNGKPVEISYMTVPDDGAEDVDELRPWAHMAIAAAHRANARKKHAIPYDSGPLALYL
tara:strand:- start:317 stop:715 length:399 start_codon:yes stop_codon:yes gene_type:complete